MSDLNGFSRRMRIRGAAVESNASRLLRRIAVVVDQTVVMATPVDTGRARANWQVSVNQPEVGTKAEPATPAAGAAEALNTGRAAINGYRSGMTLYIVNNLDYIGRLNDGWSAQAPANFVEEAVRAGVNAVASREPLVGVR